MNWELHRDRLRNGETIQIRPKGNSMVPLIYSGNLVTIVPAKESLKKGDIVFCRVGGNHYIHLIQSITRKMGGYRYQIGNNKNHTNGIIGFDNIYGKVIKVEK